MAGLKSVGLLKKNGKAPVPVVRFPELNLDGFAGCCGILVLSNFNGSVKSHDTDDGPSLAELFAGKLQEWERSEIETPEETLPGQLILASTNSGQKTAAGELQAVGFVALGSFVNPSTGNTVTLWGKIY